MADVENQRNTSTYSELEVDNTAQTPATILRPEWQFLAQTLFMILGSIMLAISAADLAVACPESVTWFLLTLGFGFAAVMIGYTLIFAKRLYERCYVQLYPISVIFFIAALVTYMVGIYVSAASQQKGLDRRFWSTVALSAATIVGSIVVLLMKMVAYFRSYGVTVV